MKYAQLSLQNSTAFRAAKLRSGSGRQSINPGVWILSFATVACLATIPNSVWDPGSLMLPAWILAAGVLGTIGADVAANGWDRVFRAEHIVLASTVIVVFPELLQGYYINALALELVRATFTSIGVFAISVGIGSSFGVPRLPGTVIDLAQRQYPVKLLFRLLVISWVLGMSFYFYSSGFSLIAMFDALRTSRWDAPWSRGQLGGWDAFGDFLKNFGFLVPLFTILLAIRLKSWSRNRVLFGLAASLVIVSFIAQGGGRRGVVVIVGSCILTWIFIKRKQLKPQNVILVAALVVATGIGAEFMLQFRNGGLVGMADSGEEAQVTGLHVDNNFFTLGETLRIIPSEAKFVGSQFLVYVLVRPVPRVFWPGKPITPGFDLAEETGQPNVSLSITMIGEFYMSYGWPGVVLGGIAIGWIARWWSQLAESDAGLSGSAFYAMGVMALFLGMRSLMELVLMSYPVVCWYGLDRFFWRWTLNNRLKVSSQLASAGAR